MIRDGTLVLRIKDDSNISAKIPLLAEVTISELDRVEASGAANVTVKGGSKVDRFTAEASGAARLSVDGLETPKAVASASGASQVVLSGTAASLDLDAAGASQIKAGELKVDDAKVTVSGASGADASREQERRGRCLGRFTSRPPRAAGQQLCVDLGCVER